MALRYQKRVNLGKGVGLNVSKSGISTSLRTKSGSIGTRGFSLKTGIPGLTFRGNFGKKGLPIMLTYFTIMAVLLVGYNFIHLVIFLITRIVKGIQTIISRNRNKW